MRSAAKAVAVVGALLISAIALSSPPYGIFQTQDDGSGTNNNGFYMVPASHTGQYIWIYDGQQGNPMRLGVLGVGLDWDGTTLSVVPPSRTFSYPTRSLNTCFRPSASLDAAVEYSVDIATSLSLTTGAQGTVYLRTYTDSSCSANTQEIVRFTNGQTGTLTIGLALNQTVTARLSGIVPAGRYAQLVTSTDVGTPTFTARPGQEVLL